jgi:hypothetical protein
MEFKQLPEEVLCMIYKSYFDKYVLTGIRQIREKNIRKINENLKYKFTNLNLNTFTHLEYLYDVGNYTSYIQFAKLNNFETIIKYLDIYTVISNFVEYYFSMDDIGRKHLKGKILGKDTEYRLNAEQLIIHTMGIFANKKYADIFDPYNSHSGFTASYCIAQILPAIFAKGDIKINWWNQLITNTIKNNLPDSVEIIND